MKYALAAALISSFLAAPAIADTYTADPNHTYPSFEISHLGFSVSRGTFDKTSGKVTLDMAAKSGSIDMTIDTASVTTGMAKRDDHLRSEEFFNVAKYPTMTYKSSKLKFNGDKLVGADGELTLLGVTKPVSLVVESFHCGAHPMNKKALCGANASASIKRSDFGMTTYVPAISDEVKIEIQIEAYKD
ncbi:MAG: YceI family protein [Betaproteobacteria bacterium]